MAQEAQQGIHELDAIRSGYQQIVDAYQDLYQGYHDRYLLSWHYETNPMKLLELQAKSPKKKKQILASTRKMLKVQTSENTVSIFDEPLFQTKWVLRKLCKLDLINKMPEGKEKKEAARFWWSIEDEDCFTMVFGEEMKEYIENMMEDAKPDQIVLQPTENQEGEQQKSISGSEEEEPEESDDDEQKKMKTKIEKLMMMTIPTLIQVL